MAEKSRCQYLQRGAPQPAHKGGERVRGSVTSPAQSYPSPQEVWHGEETRSRPLARSGSDRPAPSSQPMHKQEAVPGRWWPEGPPHLKTQGKRLLIPWKGPGGSVLGVHDRGEGRENLATEQRTGGRRLEPRPLQEPPSQERSPGSPHPPGQRPLG